MKVVSQIDQSLAHFIPFYSQASNYAQNRYQTTVATLNNIYTTSEARVKNVQKTTKGLKNQALLLCSQSADDLLDYIEEKLTIDSP